VRELAHATSTNMVAGWKGDTLQMAMPRIARLLNTCLKVFQVARIFGAVDHSVAISAQDGKI